MRTWVTFSFEASHSDPYMGHAEVHGHSYIAKVWFDNVGDRWNAEHLRESCEAARKALDHTMLDKERHIAGRPALVPPTMENIAKWIGSVVPGAVVVEISRPTLGFGAEWHRAPSTAGYVPY